MKRCPKCEQTKQLSEFHVDRSKLDGHKSWCKACLNGQDREGYADKKGEPVRPYALDPATPEAVERKRAKQQRRTRKNHGGSDVWARMFAEQDGLCYLCRQPLPEDASLIHVDHDHDCCPGGRNTRSCHLCRRGLTHVACNQVWGLARENPELLRAIASNGERVKGETKQRMAARLKLDEPAA